MTRAQALRLAQDALRRERQRIAVQANLYAMLQSAAPHFNQDALFLEFAERRGRWAAWMNDFCVYDEHAADALGLALAAGPQVLVQV